MRTVSERRHFEKRAENRKLNIIRKVYRFDDWADSLEPRKHVLSKGKVHCSCPLCRFQGTTASDLRKLERMHSDLAENGYISFAEQCRARNVQP